MRYRDIVEGRDDNPASKVAALFDEWKALHFPQVTIDVFDHDTHHIVLDRVGTASPGKGEVAQCLRKLTDLADQYQVYITGGIFGSLSLVIAHPPPWAKSA